MLVEAEVSELHRKSPEYRAWRLKVLRRDFFTCRHCGKRGGLLHAHHIKPFAEYPGLRFVVSNGLTLCPDCHAELHPWMKD